MLDSSLKTGATTDKTGKVVKTIDAADYRPNSPSLPSNFETSRATTLPTQTQGVRPAKWHWAVFIPLLLLGSYLRSFGFFLPSNIGDPTAYQSLAMKMNHGFMTEYDIYHYKMSPRKGDPGLLDYVWEEDPRLWNANRIRAIYHRSLHLQPPLFPILIWLSHGVFNRDQPYTSVAENRGGRVVQNPPWNYFHAQFYAIFVPFLCSVGTLCLVYFFCLRFFSYREGLFAVLLQLASPVDLAVGPKLYADGILTFFCLLSLFLYFISLEKKAGRAWLFASLAGASLGLAYLTKVTGILFGFGMLVATFLHPELPRSLFRRLSEKRLWLAGAFALLMFSPWLGLMYHHYGHLFLNTPADPGNPWYNYVFSRPLYAYPIDMLWFSPILGVGWLDGVFNLLNPRRRWVEVTFFLTALFYLLMFMVFARVGTAGIEDRYLLPIYPLIAVLTGCALMRIVGWFSWKWVRVGLLAGMLSLVIVQNWRAVNFGLQAVFGGWVVFKPLGF